MKVGLGGNRERSDSAKGGCLPLKSPLKGGRLIGAALYLAIQVPGVIHFHTTASDGKRTLYEYVQVAKEKEIGVLIVTDYDIQRFEYGIGPMRKWFKKVVEGESIFKSGVDNYLNSIREANKLGSGVKVLPGMESCPFYYWSGDYWRGTLSIHNAHKHILVIGLKDPDDYFNLPLVSTGKAKYDQYHGENYVLPYQDLIDYVNTKGGLTFWAHPEVNREFNFGKFKAYTQPYFEDLLRTKDYTGFAVFYEGYEKIGRPGGIWDRVLIDYCNKKRSRPVWAIGELDDHGTGDRRIDEVQTVFLVEERTEKEYLRALREGSIYAVYKVKGGISLDEFMVQTKEGTKVCEMGEEAKWESGFTLYLKVSSLIPIGEVIKTELVQEGKVIETFEGRDKVEACFNIPVLESGKTYFRLDAKDGSGNHLISNPIFLVPEFDKNN